MNASSLAAESFPQYVLQNELYRACLPQPAEDSERRLIWMNTICSLFLAGGVLGIAHPPGLILQQFAPEEAPPQVELKQLKVDPQDRLEQQDEPEPEATPVEPVPVQPVLVAPSNADVPFAVTVNGPVIVTKNLNFALPPPRETQRRAPAAPPGPRRLDKGMTGGEGRFTPDPPYPREALVRRETGSGEFLVTIDDTGGVVDLKLLTSSGSPTLDNSFRQHVRRLWRFRPEDAGQWIVPFEYRLR